MGLEGPEDPLAAKTRELQESELFNQETVAKDGTMVAPELSLSGKIIQRTNRVGDKQQVDYYFQLTATNIETGLAYWEFEEVIAKIGEQPAVLVGVTCDAHKCTVSRRLTRFGTRSRWVVLWLAGVAHAQDTGAASERDPVGGARLRTRRDPPVRYRRRAASSAAGGRAVKSGVDVDYDLIRNLQERFRARIEELLIHGRRFAVLDRRAGEIYEREKRLLASDDVDPNEAARLGKVLGADFMLYGTVDRIEVTEERRTIVLTGETSTEVTATAQAALLAAHRSHA